MTKLADLTNAERAQRMLHDVCPFRVGHAVTVRQGDDMPAWASDWSKGPFIITGIQWAYQKGDGSRFNISLASEEDIVTRCGDTDGFRVEHLEPYSR